jgi:hypothetical protein
MKAEAVVPSGMLFMVPAVSAMVADIKGAFKQGAVVGTGRLARIGVDWGGF